MGDPASAPGAPAPDVSILLLSWNTLDLTLRCLDSLPASVRDGRPTYEVVVVDNGSHDGSAEALAQRQDIVLIANSENRGYAAAVNQAYAASRGDLVLLLNSDIDFAPGSLSLLHAFLQEHQEIAGVGPLYLNPDRTVQQHHYRLPTFAMTVADSSRLFGRIPYFRRQARSHRMLDDDFSRPLRVEQPSASCLLLRRSRLPREQLLDERYPVYFNDVALADLLRRQGDELWVVPEAVVVHEHGASTRLLGGSLARQHIGAHVRFLRATQPRSRVVLFKAIVLAQKLPAIVLRSEGAMSLRDLVGALRGDPGPLPQAATRTEHA